MRKSGAIALKVRGPYMNANPRAQVFVKKFYSQRLFFNACEFIQYMFMNFWYLDTKYGERAGMPHLLVAGTRE